MRRTFKVEAIYEGSGIYYAVYRERFFWGWKFITKFVHEEDAMKLAEELSQPPKYFK